jgi:hypothetical protein
VNPLYVNAFLSLGIYMERVMADDTSSAALAWQTFEADLEQIHNVEQLIRHLKGHRP